MSFKAARHNPLFINSEEYRSNYLKRWSRCLVIAAILIGSSFFTARLFEMTQRSALRGWDNSFYLFWVRSAWLDRDLDFANDVRLSNTIAPENLDSAIHLPLTDTGLVPNKYGIGWGIASLPFFICADATTMAAQSLLGLDVPRDGFSPIYQVWLQFGQLAYALLGLYLLFLCLKLYFPTEIATLALALLWLGSPLLYYQSSNLSMAHSLVFSLLAALLYIALRTGFKSVVKTFSLFGLLAGLCLVTRYQTLPLIAVPFLFLLFNDLRTTSKPVPLKPAFAKYAALFASAVVPVLIQMIAWKIVYGHWLIFTYGENAEGFNFLNPQLSQVLFSPYNGLFYWHPLLLPATLGLLAFAWKEQRIFLFAIAAFILTIYINASWWAWHFAASFGHRGFVGSLVFLPFGIAWILKALPSQKTLNAFLTTATCLIAWNVLLCLLYSAGYIDRNGPVGPTDVISGLKQLLFAISNM